MKTSILGMIRAEVKRLGGSYEEAGPIDCVSISYSQGWIRLYDDEAEWEGEPEAILRALQGVPTEEGLIGLWRAGQYAMDAEADAKVAALCGREEE